MITQPLNASQVAEIPLGMCWAPQFMNRSERRKLNRKNPNLQKLFASMAEAKTMDIRDIEEDKKALSIAEEVLEGSIETRPAEQLLNELT